MKSLNSGCFFSVVVSQRYEQCGKESCDFAGISLGLWRLEERKTRSTRLSASVLTGSTARRAGYGRMDKRSD